MNAKIELEQQLPAEVQDALEHLLDEYWTEERVSYYCLEPRVRPGHVFESLQTIQRWITAMPPVSGDMVSPAAIRGKDWSL